MYDLLPDFNDDETQVFFNKGQNSLICYKLYNALCAGSAVAQCQGT